VAADFFDKEEQKPKPDGSELFVSAASVGTFPKAVLQGLALTYGFSSAVNQIKLRCSLL
jgi:hypothetical protein